MSYFANISRGIRTTLKGMNLTLRHFWNARKSRGAINVEHPDYFSFSEGHVTLQYPHETLSVPETGRYQLDCEIDDCIVCDKCAKICPVDCIEIEAVKSPELIRYTSDGSPVRLHAARFDIDMAKCCFCGLCTTVCPTECLIMNSEYDYSVIDITQLNFAFSNLSDEEVQEKKDLYQQYVAEKEAAKQAKPLPASAPATGGGFVPKSRPVMKPATQPGEALEEPGAGKGFTPQPRPVPKPAEQAAPPSEPVIQSVPKFQTKIRPATSEPVSDETPDVKPVSKFQPKMKPAGQSTTSDPSQAAPDEIPEVKPVPKFQPKMKPAGQTSTAEPVQATPDETPEAKPAPKFQPKMRPTGQSTTSEPSQAAPDETPEVKSVPKFQPKMKPAGQTSAAEPVQATPDETPEAKPAPKFQPKMRPPASVSPAGPSPAEAPEDTKDTSENPDEVVSNEEAKPKAVFKPTLKPGKKS